MKKNNKAFTLIELMVVISIIGLISSIVLVSVKNARDRARIAAGLQFSSSVHHVLGAEVVGMWDFNESSGTTAQDASGYNNHGTLHNFAASHGYVTDTPSGTGYALSFDGSNNYVEIPVSYPSTLALRDTDSLTIEAWVKPESISGYRSAVARRTGGPGLYIYEGKVNFVANRQWGADLSSIPVTVRVGNWYHLVGTFDLNLLGTDKAVRVFVNGEEKSFHDDSSIHSGNWPIFIGVFDTIAGGGKYYYFQGMIDEVRIYKQALSQAQVEVLYAEGVAERGLVIK